MYDIMKNGNNCRKKSIYMLVYYLLGFYKLLFKKSYVTDYKRCYAL